VVLRTGGSGNFDLVMPIPIAELQKAAEPLTSRILRFLEAHPDQAFSVLEIIEAVEEIPANEIPELVLAQRRAKGESALLNAFNHALHQLEFDAAYRVVLSADHGGTRYFGIDPVRKTA
jgi:UDP-glucose 4-epimerase